MDITEDSVEEMRRVMELVRDEEEVSSVLGEVKQELNEILTQLEEKTRVNSDWYKDQLTNTGLSDRCPLQQSVTTVLLESDVTKTDLLSRATSLLVAIGELYLMVGEDNQLGNMLGVSRIPGKEKDEIIKKSDSKHVTLMYKHGVYTVYIIDEKSCVHSAKIIQQQLQSILQKNVQNAKAKVNDIIAYTGKPRCEWFEFRSKLLLETGESVRWLEELESSIAAVTLEQQTSAGDPGERLKHLLTGSRYYDKILNVVVYKDGQAGLIIGHSNIDYPGAFVFSEKLFEVAKCVDIVEKVICEIDDDVGVMLNSGNDCEVVMLNVPVSRDVITVMCDADVVDAWLILSLQLTLMKNNLTDYLLSSYTGKFQHGYTEPMYPVSKESKCLIETMLNKESHQEQQHHCEMAIEKHKTLSQASRESKININAVLFLLRRRLSDQRILNFLAHFNNPDVVVTDCGQDWQGIHCWRGNSPSPCQLTVNYMIKCAALSIVISSRGKFTPLIHKLKTDLKRSLEEMVQLVVRLAIRKVMTTDLPLQLTQHTETVDSSNKKWALALHAGAGATMAAVHKLAGGILGDNDSVEEIEEYALTSALRLGYDMLKSGLSSLDCVQQVTAALENCFLFNAGKGSVYNCKGDHELEAALADGDHGLYGAMVCLKTVKNPIAGARLVMDKTNHCILAGEAAEKLCEEQGLILAPNSYFHTHYRKLTPAEQSDTHGQTVGAVAVDSRGKLAAACSTGGLRGKMPGRIGDTPINGAGLVATGKCAVSCTGKGEVFLRNRVASSVDGLMTFGDKTLSAACEETVSSLSYGDGGLIAVDREGNIECVFNCAVLATGKANSSGVFVTKILKKANNQH